MCKQEGLVVEDPLWSSNPSMVRGLNSINDTTVEDVFHAPPSMLLTACNGEKRFVGALLAKLLC